MINTEQQGMNWMVEICHNFRAFSGSKFFLLLNNAHVRFTVSNVNPWLLIKIIPPF